MFYFSWLQNGRKDKYFFQTLHTFNENVPHKIAHIVQYIFFPIVNNQLSIVNKKGIFAPEKECLLFRVLAKPRTKNKKDMKHKKEAALACKGKSFMYYLWVF